MNSKLKTVMSMRRNMLKSKEIPDNDCLLPKETHWCSTDIMVEKSSFIWTINDFSLCTLKNDERLTSSNFQTGKYAEWCMHLYPRGRGKDNEKYLSIYLEFIPSRRNEVSAKYKISIIDSNGQRSYISKTDQYSFNFVYTVTGYPRFIFREYLMNNSNGLIAKDTLKIYCEIFMSTEIKNWSGTGQMISIDLPVCQFRDSVWNMAENGKFSDIILCAGGKKFSVHKVILAAGSPVFDAMFQHDMAENKNGIVEIDDTKPEIIEEMLRFFYTGKVSSPEKLDIEMMAVANKYDIKRLKRMCENWLSINLSVETAAEVLMCADLFSADQLKVAALNFIKMNIHTVKDTPGWKELLKHPDSINELILELSKIHIGPATVEKAAQIQENQSLI